MSKITRKRYGVEFKSRVALEAIEGMAATFSWNEIFDAMPLLGWA